MGHPPVPGTDRVVRLPVSDLPVGGERAGTPRGLTPKRLDHPFYLCRVEPLVRVEKGDERSGRPLCHGFSGRSHPGYLPASTGSGRRRRRRRPVSCRRTNRRRRPAVRGARGSGRGHCRSHAGGRRPGRRSGRRRSPSHPTTPLSYYTKATLSESTASETVERGLSPARKTFVHQQGFDTG